jgi:hypothetical protein
MALVQECRNLRCFEKQYVLFTLAAQLNTLPILVYHFHCLSLVSLVAKPPHFASPAPGHDPRGYGHPGRDGPSTSWQTSGTAGLAPSGLHQPPCRSAVFFPKDIFCQRNPSPGCVLGLSFFSASPINLKCLPRAAGSGLKRQR